MKIGLIQTRGLGDIVIAAPIAMYYIDRGCEVFWPIDSEFISSFSDAFPKINFLPIHQSITGASSAQYFYYAPLEELNRNNCEVIFCLYSHLTGFDFGYKRLQEALTFDAYKYAVAKVPFQEKWNFHPRRNPAREARVYEMLGLNINEKYNIVHDQGSNISLEIDSYIENKDIKTVKISAITDNIFDWISVIERSESVYFIDSVYANITEQLNIKVKKSFVIRSAVSLTPVLVNSWKIL